MTAKDSNNNKKEFRYRGYTFVANPATELDHPDNLWRARYFITRPWEDRPFAEARTLIQAKALINDDIN